MPVKDGETLAALLDGIGETATDDVSGDAAAGARDLLTRCAHALYESDVSPERPVCAFFVPGRIEVLGKHTDYAGGRSLLCAVQRGFCILAATRPDDRVVMADAKEGNRIEFQLAPAPRREVRGWPNYPMAVARRIVRNFPGPFRGADIAFASSLPAASGMSSSSAFVVATFLALSAVNGLPSTEAYRDNIHGGEDLADYLAAVENGRDYRELAGDRGVGTRGGSEDHTAILCARPGELVQYAFDPARFERAVAMPPDHVFAIGCSGVRAEKTGAARARYNRAARNTRIAAELWRTATVRSDATLGAVLDSDPGAADRLRRILRVSDHPGATPHELLERLDQFSAESREIIPAAADALAEGRLADFGELVDRSQELAERVLGNQIGETMHLARSAREGGAVAASAFGAGFGGSVWAMAGEEQAVHFLDSWRTGYLDRFPHRAADAAFFLTAPGPPARRIL